jgi:hypothetical protein
MRITKVSEDELDINLKTFFFIIRFNTNNSNILNYIYQNTNNKNTIGWGGMGWIYLPWNMTQLR